MIKRKLIVAFVTSLFSVSVFATPVLARNGDGTDGNSGSGSSQGSISPTNTTSTEPKIEDSASHQERARKIEQETPEEEREAHRRTLETETETEISGMMKEHSRHSDADRQKNCQDAEHGLETKLQSLSTNATNFHTKIDTALANAIAYQKANNVVVTNFDALVAAAQAAQSTSAASVSALNGLSPNLDCAQATVATNVAQFKVAAKQARTDLIAYKNAVKAVLQALEAAKEGN